MRAAAAGLTKVRVPSAAMAQTPSPMLSVIEESRSRSMRTCWYSSALLRAPVPTAARARSSPRSVSSKGSSRRRPAAVSQWGWPAMVMAAAGSPADGADRVTAASGLRRSRRTDSRMVSSTGCCRSCRLASSVTWYSPSIRARSYSAAYLAPISQRPRIRPGTTSAIAQTWARMASASTRPAITPAPASVIWIRRSLVNSSQVMPIEAIRPVTRAVLTISNTATPAAIAAAWARPIEPDGAARPRLTASPSPAAVSTWPLLKADFTSGRRRTA